MTNIQKLMDAVPGKNTCALITSDINRRYFTGMKSSAGIIMCFKEKAYLIIDFRYYEKAVSIVSDCEVILEKDRTVQINELLKKHGTSVVMIEADNMTVSGLNSLRMSFPKINIDFSSSLSSSIDKMRIIKSESEIQRIECAQKITDDTFMYVLDTISEGMTEKELAMLIDDHIKQLGAEDISFNTIALSGKNTSLPHGVPGCDKIQKNCFILMDFGAIFDGMHSDMTRTVYFGEPCEEEIMAYNVVLETQLQALENIRAGVLCSELDQAAHDYINGKGYEGSFGHSLGHGVGMEIHEKPAVSRTNEYILQKGNIITVEPGIYLPGKFGIRIEDMVMVDEVSYRNFTKSKKELIKL